MAAMDEPRVYFTTLTAVHHFTIALFFSFLVVHGEILALIQGSNQATWLFFVYV